MMTLNPSFDFRLFDIPNFSPLYANEFSADTSFSNNTPTSYVDFSLNRLANVLQTPNEMPFEQGIYPGPFNIPGFQSFFGQEPGYYDPTQGRVIGGRLPQPTTTERRDVIVVYPSGQTPPELERRGPDVPEGATKGGCNFFDLITFRCKPPYATESGKAEGTGPIIGSTPQVSGRQPMESFWKNLPEGAGVFLLGIIALVFLLLFIRR